MCLPKKKSDTGKMSIYQEVYGCINARDVGRYLTLKTERQITILQNALRGITLAVAIRWLAENLIKNIQEINFGSWTYLPKKKSDTGNIDRRK